MPRCEDYPCCGHESGDCPDSSGRMTCVECGKRLPKAAVSSICNVCLRRMATRDESDLDHDFSMNY
jgi:NMD protein affecting ribosome stability and mRNA decay